MIATIHTPHNLIIGPPGIIKFDKEGITYTFIQNCTAYSMWIERNGPQGFVKHLMEKARSKKLDKKFAASLMQQVTISSITQDKLMK